MSKSKSSLREKQCIEERLVKLAQHLANAEEYVAQQRNVEGTAFLHLDDWRGRSGHPAWMENWMIPSLKKCRASKEKTLDQMNRNEKDRNLSNRKRKGKSVNEQSFHLFE